MHEKWIEENYARWENSFGATEPVKVQMSYEVKINEDRNYGFFEIYSINGNSDFYAEGGIWLNEDNSEVIDFDGVFDLPKSIKERLSTWGIVCRWG